MISWTTSPIRKAGLVVHIPQKLTTPNHWACQGGTKPNPQKVNGTMFDRCQDHLDARASLASSASNPSIASSIEGTNQLSSEKKKKSKTKKVEPVEWMSVTNQWKSFLLMFYSVFLAQQKFRKYCVCKWERFTLSHILSFVCGDSRFGYESLDLCKISDLGEVCSVFFFFLFLYFRISDRSLFRFLLSFFFLSSPILVLSKLL